MFAFIRQTWFCFAAGALLVLATVHGCLDAMAEYKPEPMPLATVMRLQVQLSIGVVLVAIAMVRWIIRAIKEGPPKHDQNPAD
jgi:hypothetical protein